jgi:hypothetical protein
MEEKLAVRPCVATGRSSHVVPLEEIVEGVRGLIQIFRTGTAEVVLIWTSVKLGKSVSGEKTSSEGDIGEDPGNRHSDIGSEIVFGIWYSKKCSQSLVVSGVSLNKGRRNCCFVYPKGIVRVLLRLHCICTTYFWFKIHDSYHKHRSASSSYTK